ncbi:uncharacterized protein LOC132295991 [Cornus florida]|uniref:uncharacterized protein LOC132295991 n=1 Tax=Cornus florida TaxID=4283 RepID=UPI00289E5359|nr:uncharacterized protein LOC132295991 [Cornus florida]
MDRSWIQNENRCSTEYKEEVGSFMNFAQNHADSEGKIRCPCHNCCNVLFQSLDDVGEHLFVHGFNKTYTKWIHHGENMWDDEVDMSDNDDYTTYNEVEEPDFMQHILEDIHTGTSMRDSKGEAFTENSSNVAEGPTSSNKFATLLSDMERELYPGCKNFSKLSFLIQFFHVKVLNGWTNKSFDMVLQLFNKAREDNEPLPKSHYEARKIMRELGLGYQSIHACENDCMLFWKDYEKDKYCSVCEESRYKIPRKVLRYFPLKPRLQMLFMCRKTATDMVWHKVKRIDDGILRHPADYEA